VFRHISSYASRILKGAKPADLPVVQSAKFDSDALKVNAGTRLALNQYASLFASFDGEFANSGQSYAGRGGIRFSW
jgi:outer membrane autotransporter protein